MAKLPTLFLLFSITTSAIAFAQASAGPDTTPSAISAPLSLEQIVDNLVRRNDERAQALRSSEATRIYHLVYRGFPGDREATMTVHAIYDSPDRKEFQVVCESGSKLILNRVLRKLLESEVEAARPEMRSRLQLNRDNYDFAFDSYVRTKQGGQYVLDITPKSKSKYVYRGRIWIDDTDFAVTRIEAQPAQNPSFWTKKSLIHHDYIKVQGFWVPACNESNSDIRLGGHATLTIEYTDYKINVPHQSSAVSTSSKTSLVPSGSGASETSEDLAHLDD